MSIFFRNKITSVISIEITKHAIALLQIIRTKEGLKVLSYANKHYEQPLIDAKGYLLDTSIVSDYIKYNVHINKHRQTALTTYINRRNLLTHLCCLGANVQQRDIQEYVQNNIEKYIPLHSTDIAFDYLDYTHHDTAFAAIAACHNAQLHSYQQIAKAVNIELSLVGIEEQLQYQVLQHLVRRYVRNIDSKYILCLSMQKDRYLLLLLDNRGELYPHYTSDLELVDGQSSELYTKWLYKWDGELYDAAAISEVITRQLAAVLKVYGVAVDAVIVGGITFSVYEQLNVSAVKCVYANPFEQMEIGADVKGLEERSGQLLALCGSALTIFGLN